MKSLSRMLSLVALVALSACTTAPKTEAGRTDIRDAAASALANAKRTDPTLATVLRDAAGYAVFPSVGKGAVGVGAAYGKGVLYEGGRFIGYCDLTQGSVGVQLGGQSYTEIISFRTTDALNRFKGGNFSFDTQASAVALKSGASANARYTNDVTVFTMDEKGLMFEAAIAGQKFTYQPD